MDDDDLFFNNTCQETVDKIESALKTTAWVFLIVKFVIFLVCVSTCSLIYAIHWILKKKKMIRYKKKMVKKVISIYGLALRRRIRQLKSGDTIPGKILITVTLICNIIYLILAIYRSLPPHMVNECTSIRDTNVVIELLLTFELLFFTLVRFLSSDNIALFWFNPYTLVDVWTLPHIFITLSLGVDWLGLRYLRFAWLIQITAVLQFAVELCSEKVRIFKKAKLPQNVVDLINVTIYFMTLWLASSGILHVIESVGDFWKNEHDPPHTVLTYVYFTMVTMSTVGYGDFSPVSDLGRLFMIFFIIGGLAFFASILPTLVEVVTGYYARSQYSRFDKSRVPKHVIVCGHITADTVKDFLKDFLHPDRGDHQTHVLLLHPKRPDEDLKNTIRTYYTRVQFLHGSSLSGKDLHKAKIYDAHAVFILTNKYTDNPKKEDHENLLRVVSVKNTAIDMRCVVQLLHSFSRHQALGLQGWRAGHDIAVCIGELKLGLLAQSCLYPGFSTLIANMFYTVDVEKFISDDDNDEESWKKNFGKGLSTELYTGTFSDVYFKRRTFHEAAKTCFEKLGLVLLAVEDVEEHEFYVNPSPNSYPDFQLKPKTMWGYFVAQNQIQVSRASEYCDCHDNMRHPGALKAAHELQRRLRKMRWQEGTPPPENFLSIENTHFETHHSLPQDGGAKMKYKKEVHEAVEDQDSDNDSDDDGDDDNVSPDDQFLIHVLDKPMSFEQAVITNPSTILAKESPHKFNDHIILCLFGDSKSPPLWLFNFLKPLRSKHIPRTDIKPVVIVCQKAYIKKEWQILSHIPEIYLVLGEPLRWVNLRAAQVSTCSVCVILTAYPTAAEYDDETAIDDKEAILCTLSIQKEMRKLKKKMLIITDLRHESNVQFLDFGDEDNPDERIYKAEPYAAGRTFSVSMFDSVTSSAFHNPGLLNLLEALVKCSRKRRIKMTPIADTTFVGSHYGDFYVFQLKKHEICLGLSRKNPSNNYIITCPEKELLLQATDIAFMLTD